MAPKTLLLALTALLALATSASAFSGEGTAYAGARPQHTKPSTPSRLPRHSRPASLIFAQLTRYLRHAPLAEPGSKGMGACGLGNVGFYETYFAAMNSAQFAGTCGSCISVSGAAGTRVVMVVDLCPGCRPGDVDLSAQARPGGAWAPPWPARGYTAALPLSARADQHPPHPLFPCRPLKR
jgi:hypothetical protein